MKRFFVLAIATCLSAGALVGCKPGGEKAASPPPKVEHAAQPSSGNDSPSPWTLAPTVTDSASDGAGDVRRSPYTPIENAATQAEAPPEPSPPYQPAAPEAATLVPEQAPAGSPPEVAAAPPPAAELPYDPALDAAGQGRSSPSTYSGGAAPRMEALSESNPLRTAEPSSEPTPRVNPLRSSAPRMMRSMAAPSYAPSSPDPAGGAAAPASELTTGETAAESAAVAQPRSVYSAQGVYSPEAAMAPEGADVVTESAPPGSAAAAAQADRQESANMAMSAMGEPPPYPPETNSPAAAAQASAPPQPFDTVKVFYGTDRLAWQPNQDTWTAIGVRYWPTLAAVGVAALFGFLALLWRHWLSATLALGGLVVAGALGFLATSTTLERHRIAQKEGVRYLAERSVDGEVEMGICEVTIPKTHEPGALEAPSILRLEIHEDKTRHVVLQKTERLADDEFFTQLRQRVGQSQDEELFVFIHGFNVSFEDAARRTAQMAHDLKYDGAPVFFSWPASDKFLLTYAQDETNVGWASSHLKRFLLDVARESEAKSINVIAHSMGNRALTTVLRELELELRDDARLFNQVVLAAPDIDADDFRLNIAPFIQRTSRRITLYASSNDHALAASQLVHRYPRAGDSGEMLVVVPGIETVDVSAIDGGPWGHSYYGSSDPLLKDLAVLLSGASDLPRSWLSARSRGDLSYWVFQAEAAAARAAGSEASLR